MERRKHRDGLHLDVSSDLSYLYYITMFPHISLSSVTLDVTHHDVSSDLPLYYYIRCNPSRCFLLSLSSITLGREGNIVMGYI
jgi:hypothetical protein